MGYDANDLLSTLLYMKKQFGIDVFHDAKKMNSILGDLSPNLKRDGKILQRLLIAGLFQELEETDFTNEIEKLRARGRVKNWLIDEEFIQEEKAVYYSQIVCAVYGGYDESIVFLEQNKQIYRQEIEKDIPDYVEEVMVNRTVINKSSDFIIENKKLIKYVGNDEVIIIPDGIEIIGLEAVNVCDGLKKVTIPQSVIHISGFAFACCKNLEEVIFSEGLKKIGNLAFNGCSSIKKIVLPESLEELGDNCFAVCESLDSIIIPKNVKKIGRDVFRYCISLRSIKLPENLEEIEKNCFSTCKKLEHVIFPTKLKKIGITAFTCCESLKRVELPNSLEEIGSGAFARCQSLENINIPEGIRKIEYAVFANCDSLTAIIIPKSVEIIEENAFIECKNLVSISIPKRKIRICKNAFLGCSSLKKVELSEDAIVEENAFPITTEVIVLRNHIPKLCEENVITGIDTKTPNKEKYGTLNIIVKNSINPLSLADGTSYRFVIDSKKIITLIVGKGNTVEKIELSKGKHTVNLSVYGWGDTEMKKAPIHSVNIQNFEIFEGRVTKLIANRPGLLSSQTLSVKYE